MVYIEANLMYQHEAIYLYFVDDDGKLIFHSHAYGGLKKPSFWTGNSYEWTTIDDLEMSFKPSENTNVITSSNRLNRYIE